MKSNYKTLSMILLDIMGSGEKIKLNKFGKERMAKIDSTSINVEWDILAINCDYTLRICSENHFIYGGAPIDWFEINPLKEDI